MSEAVSFAERATDEKVTCLRIFADPNGESHMQEVDFPLLPKQVFKDNPPLRLSETLERFLLDVNRKCHRGISKLAQIRFEVF